VLSFYKDIAQWACGLITEGKKQFQGEFKNEYGKDEE
jgi:hypothetical protein